MCTLHSNTSITTLFKRNTQKFDKMFKTVAFTKTFLRDNPDEYADLDELTEARERVQKSIDDFA